MVINGIDFPDDLIEEFKNNNVVVFAGAGVSAPKPTNFPDFIKLANIIAKGTGWELVNKKSKNSKVQQFTDAPEIFLGRLKTEKSIDVNNICVSVFKDDSKKPNSEHEAIVNLFDDINNLKIVTTNYDHMFEDVITDKNLRIYNSPALPLGDNFTGIVHIHGNIDEPENMILTDSDYGNAYITRGYVARFLIDLFKKYTVLFIGYS